MKTIGKILIHDEYDRLKDFFDNMKYTPRGIPQFPVHEDRTAKEMIEIIDKMTTSMAEDLKFFSKIKGFLERKLKEEDK